MSIHRQSSPQFSSSDVYERKMYRLQTENITLKDQLQTILYKLRSLEDIQLKYELLLGQSQNQNQRLKMNEISLEKKVQQQIQNLIQEKDLQLSEQKRKLQQEHKDQIISMRQKHGRQKQELISEYDEIKKLYESISSKASQIQVFSFKLKKYQKQIEQLQVQLQAQKLASEQSRQRQLHEQKFSLTKKLKTKYDSQLQSYEQKLRQLTKRNTQLQLSNDLLHQKTKSVAITQQSSNIQKLKEILSQRNRIEKDQVTKMQEALERANGSLKKIMEEKHQIEIKYGQKEEELKKYVGELQLQLMELEKSNLNEIFNLQARMKMLREQQVGELKGQNQQLKDTFDKERKVWQNLSNEHAQQVKDLLAQKQKTKQEFQKQNYLLKQKIKQLKTRLSDNENNMLSGQTQNMIASLKDIDQRQDSLSKYENGIVFLERQLKKSAIKVEEKNQQIIKLIKQVTQIHTETQTQLSQLRQKAKKDRRQMTQKILNLENQVRDLGDRLRSKQRQMQKKQKQTSFEKLQLEKQIQALKDMNQQLKRDYDRAISTSKTIDNQYRDERDKGVTAKGDFTHLKRIKWLELQKQKNDLEIIFREKEQQLKIIYERKIDELRNQRDLLRHKATLLDDDKDLLTAELQEVNKKLQNKQNISNKASKKRSGDMQKKMASLNLQIALTKNLFQNLQKAKSRLKQRDFTQRTQQQVSHQQEQNEQDFD